MLNINSIHLYNTLTNSIEKFIPIQENKVKIYSCGVTVYDKCHIGHARVQFINDILIRYLIFCGYEVFFVRNITDIDDKIIDKSHQLHISTNQLSEIYIKEMDDNFDLMNLIKPDKSPRATNYIEEMIQLITILIEKKHAYPTIDGHVYFDISSYKNYGQLSNQELQSLQTQELERSLKSQREDFVLWKPDNECGWPSPWSYGRPGWHIECSAITTSELGKNFDIHTGGTDLIFPHHENEIAQSYCAHKIIPAKYWLHTALIYFNQKKMSKSENNKINLEDILSLYEGDIIRFFILQSHYRSIIHFQLPLLEATNTFFSKIKKIVLQIEEGEIEEKHKEYINQFIKYMNNDLNTPEVIKLIAFLVKQINIFDNLSLKRVLKQIMTTLGFQLKDSFQDNLLISQEKIKEIITQRNIYRSKKEYVKSDLLRNYLLSKGIILEDNEEGTQYRINNIEKKKKIKKL